MWNCSSGIIAYPNLWQTPAKTEQWVYDHCSKSLKDLKFTQLVCFPWATLIDCLNKQEQRKTNHLLAVLKQLPPRKTLKRVTVCQHIDALELLNLFKEIKITDLYLSHATMKQKEVEGIRIHPFPLYPVQCFNKGKKQSPIPIQNRSYLYSFIGAYSEGLYLTDVRKWIFQIKTNERTFFKKRYEWHFENDVYKDQINQLELSRSEREINKKNSQEYIDILEKTIFSLCPSGSGPNSIRLWESLGFGCIPVLLSDSLRLPEDELWKKAIIQIPENYFSVMEMPEMLEEILKNRDKINQMQLAGKELWQKYCSEDPGALKKQLSLEY